MNEGYVLAMRNSCGVKTVQFTPNTSLNEASRPSRDEKSRRTHVGYLSAPKLVWLKKKIWSWTIKKRILGFSIGIFPLKLKNRWRSPSVHSRHTAVPVHGTRVRRRNVITVGFSSKFRHWVNVGGRTLSSGSWSPTKIPDTHWIGYWMGLTAGLDRTGEKKVSYHYQDSNSGPSSF